MFPEHVSDHLYQFGTLGGFSKNNCSAFQLIWLSCVWVIWLERNACVFQQTEASITQLLDKVKLQSYWWLKANRPSFVFSTIHGGEILYLAWELLRNMVAFFFVVISCFCFPFVFIVIDTLSAGFSALLVLKSSGF